MVDLYKRVIDGVADLGFPLSVHFEAAYGVSRPAFDTLAEMLAYWSPDNGCPAPPIVNVNSATPLTPPDTTSPGCMGPTPAGVPV